jgi:hypothetical protein
MDTGDHIKHGIDLASVGLWLAALVDFTPHVTALLSLAWVSIRIYETRTVQKWVKGEIIEGDE